MFEFVDDALRALGAAARAESSAVARKLALAADVARLRREADGRDQVPVSHQAEFVAAEVATALAVSTAAAHGLISLGECLSTRLPETRRALERGDLDLVKVRTIVERTASIDDLGVLAEVEHRVLDVALVPDRCVTRGQVARVVDQVVAAVDPQLIITRRKRAVMDRDVTLRPDVDGMSVLWGLLTGPDGRVVDARLREMALSVCGEDPRTLAQRRADAVVALAHGDAFLACQCGSPVCPAAASEATHHRCQAVIQVVVPVETLVGGADLPGVLAGYGIVDPDLMRTLAVDARWQRLLILDGVPIVEGDPALALRYTPSVALARAVRARDGHCRFPGCTVPATSCDLDHTIPFDHAHAERGGHTVVANVACLCRWHHRMKTESHWRVRMDSYGTQHWTGPAGQTLSSVPGGLPDMGVNVRNSGARAAGRPPPAQCSPVTSAPRTTRALPCPGRRHPDHYLPSDDHAPSRWTDDGRWAEDAWTGRDSDATLDHLVRDAEVGDRRRRFATGLVPAVALAAVDEDEPPPF